MDFCIAVDIGNSGLRCSRLDLDSGSVGEPIRIPWRPASSSSKALMDTTRFSPAEMDWLGQLRLFLDGLLAGESNARIEWFVASVRADALQVLRDFVGTRAGDHLHVLSYADIPLRLNVEFPDRVGIDRLLAATAAVEISQSRHIVTIQAGSAVTVDLVVQTPDGYSFEGGAILPGVPMMLRLLGQAADQLPELDADDLTTMPALPGRNTVEAMVCGTASALVGGVQHLVDRYAQCYGDVVVILGGGDGTRLLPHLALPTNCVPHLVEKGIVVVAQRLRSRSVK